MKKIKFKGGNGIAIFDVVLLISIRDSFYWFFSMYLFMHYTEILYKTARNATIWLLMFLQKHHHKGVSISKSQLITANVYVRQRILSLPKTLNLGMRHSL